MKHIFLFLFLISNNTFSQKEHFNLSLIDKKDIKESFLEKNLKNIFMNNDFFIGFYGDNKEKVDIKIISVIKDFEDNTRYFTYGRFRLKGKVSDFQGFIVIKNMNRYIDHKHRFLIRASYNFYIDSFNNKLHTLKGKSLYKVTDKKGKVEIDLTDFFTPNFYFATYIGHLTDVNRNKTILNWGSYHPPLCGDLDVGGKHGFKPNPKYRIYGWAQMIDAYNTPSGVKILGDSFWWK